MGYPPIHRCRARGRRPPGPAPGSTPTVCLASGLAVPGRPPSDFPQALPSAEPTLYSSYSGRTRPNAVPDLRSRQGRPRERRQRPGPIEPPGLARAAAVDGRHRQLQRLARRASGSSRRWPRRPRSASGRCEVVVVDNASAGPIPAELPRPPPRGPPRLPGATTAGSPPGSTPAGGASKAPGCSCSTPTWSSPDGLLGQVARPDRATSRRDPAGPPGIVGFGLRNPDGTRQPSVGAFPSLARTVWEQLIPRSRRKYQAGWRTRPGPGRLGHRAPACWSTPRLLRRAGGMDEDFFLYYEEVALCRAARRPGLAGRVRPERRGRPPTSLAESGRSRPRCGSSPGTASCSISASTCPAGSSWGSRGSSRPRRCSGGLVRGPGTGRGRTSLADDRRGGAAASGRGRSCGDARCWRWPEAGDGDAARAPRDAAGASPTRSVSARKREGRARIGALATAKGRTRVSLMQHAACDRPADGRRRRACSAGWPVTPRSSFADGLRYIQQAERDRRGAPGPTA